jgi:hypothetical protein
MTLSSGNEEAFVSDESHGMTAYTFADRAKKRVADLGIGNYQRPRLEKDHESIIPHLKRGDYFDGRLPTVIRKLTLDQLSALYSLFSNWFGYITTQFMLVAADRSEAICQRDFLLTNIKNYYRVPDPEGKRLPEAAITDAAKQDKRYVMAKAKYEELNLIYESIQAMREVANQDMKVISREVTIQQEKHSHEMMLHGFGNRGRERDFTNAVEGGYGDASENPDASEERLAKGAAPRRQVRVPRIFGR